MNLEFLSKRKQDGIAPEKLRVYSVNIALNLEEIELLDAAREGTKFSRAELMRSFLFSSKIERSPIVPSINLETARDLGRALGNLQTVAGAMRLGDFVELPEIRRVIFELQQKLRGLHGNS